MANEPTSPSPHTSPLPPPPLRPEAQQPPSQPAPSPPPSPPAPASSGSGVVLSGPAWWSIVSVVTLVVAVSLEEDGDNGWGRIGVWAAFAIAAAAVTLAPSMRQQLNLSVETAWRIAAAGGIGLAAFWVLLVLPVISDNLSFVATVGCAAGAYAAWHAPGRPGGDGSVGGERAF